MKVQIAGRFVEDWQPAAEQLLAEAEAGDADQGYIKLIDSIDNASRTKRGKHGFSIAIELSETEVELLRSEAQYRMEFWSLLYQDCKADIDRASHNAAKKLYLELGGVITEQMAQRMGIKI
jgi:hypothetical protein